MHAFVIFCIKHLIYQNWAYNSEAISFLFNTTQHLFDFLSLLEGSSTLNYENEYADFFFSTFA